VTNDELHRVLVISANDLYWTGIHVALQSISDVVIVDDVTDLGCAITRARELQPDAIVTGLRVAGISMLPILEAIAAGCPAARMIVLAEAFQPAELDALTRLNVAACLRAHDLDFAVLRRCVGAVLSGDFVLFSRPDLAQLLTLRAVRPAPPPISLTESERVVVAGLAAGLTLEQIARDAPVSVRTVKRTRAALAEKLHATSSFLLGVKAHQLALLPAPPG
jgi:DNA-binding NarL/FixJ family response regulator